jgi:hypothetical protein
VLKGDYVTHDDAAIYVVGWIIFRISYSVAVRMLHFKVYIIQSYGAISLSESEFTNPVS